VAGCCQSGRLNFRYVDYESFTLIGAHILSIAHISPCHTDKSFSQFRSQVSSFGTMNRMLPLTAWPIGWFLLASFFFLLSVQQEGRKRNLLAMLYSLAISICLSSNTQVLALLPPFFIPWLIGWILHTTLILLFRKQDSQLCSQPLSHRLRQIIPLWTDLRGLECDPRVAKRDSYGKTGRLFYGMRKTTHALTL
jgi:hypothetical protein